MSREGFIVLSRGLPDSWLWDLPAEQFKVAVAIIYRCNWKAGQTFSGGQLVRVKRGQCMTSLGRLADFARVSQKTIRTTLKNLEAAGFLANESTSRYRLLTVHNYERYQGLLGIPGRDGDDQSDGQRQAERQASGKPNGKPAASQRQGSGKPAATIEPRNQSTREPGNQSERARADEPTDPSLLKPSPRDIARVHADQIWQEHDDLRRELQAEGIEPGARGIGFGGEDKVELIHRLCERAKANVGDWAAAAEDCRHVLRVGTAEARVKRSLRWFSPRIWEPKPFKLALSRDPITVAAEAQPPTPWVDPKEVQAATAKVVAAFNSCFKRELPPTPWTGPVRDALAAGFTEAEMRGAIWWASGAWNGARELDISPRTILRLEARGSGKSLPEYLSLADEEWPKQHDGESPPWRPAERKERCA